jgi:hypothetical protein
VLARAQALCARLGLRPKPSKIASSTGLGFTILPSMKKMFPIKTLIVDELKYHEN